MVSNFDKVILERGPKVLETLDEKLSKVEIISPEKFDKFQKLNIIMETTARALGILYADVIEYRLVPNPGVELKDLDDGIFVNIERFLKLAKSIDEKLANDEKLNAKPLFYMQYSGGWFDPFSFHYEEGGYTPSDVMPGYFYQVRGPPWYIIKHKVGISIGQNEDYMNKIYAEDIKSGKLKSIEEHLNLAKNDFRKFCLENKNIEVKQGDEEKYGFWKWYAVIDIPIIAVDRGEEIILGFVSFADIPNWDYEPISDEAMSIMQKIVNKIAQPISDAFLAHQWKIQNTRLEDTLRELKDAQAELVNEQRMAGIGTLASGVAHEINNPASSILSKSETLKKLMGESIDSVCEFLMFESKDKEIYSSLLKEIVSYALNKPPLSTREVRNLKNSFRTVFEQINENLADEFAVDYSEMYFSNEQLNKITPLLKKYGAEKLTKFTQLFFNMAKTASLNLNAAQDIVNITNALKGSARIGEYGLMNIRKGLEDTLLIYKTTLINAGLDFEKDIIRKYVDVPTTFGYEAELRQVWRNLIENAVQAMEERKAKEPEYQPKLAIEASQKDNYISVTIQDNGCGIPEEVQKRIFEPLITTREQGKGTGLGLYIIKKNIEKHDGRINWQSQPGNTLFEVLLPIVSQAEPE